MHFIFHQKQRRATQTVATSMAVLAVLLTGCANTENTSQHTANKEVSSSASASASSSSSASNRASAKAEESSSPVANDKTASSQPSTSSSAKAGGNAQTATPTTQPSTSPDTKSAKSQDSGSKNKGKQVELTDQNVVTTKNLYGKYEDVLANVKTKKVKDASADAANSQEPVKEDIVLDSPSIGQIKKIATGSAADEFTASAQEFGTSGWKQEGKAKFVGKPVLSDITYQGQPAKQLEVCVDSSKVVIKDSANNLLKSKKAHSRSINIFTLVQENGSWKIAYRTMPDNPDC